MKKSLLIIVLFLVSIAAGCGGGSDSDSGHGGSGTHPAYAWTKQMGGSGYDFGRSIARDSSGNLYLTGWFRDTVDFGADFGTSDSKTSSGGDDIFLTKINANGTYAWSKRMGGSSNDRGFSITTDPSGNVYLTGWFDGTVDFGADFGASDTKTPVSAPGYSSIYVTKINANGTYAWTKQMGGAGTSGGVGHSITTDPSGNVYLTGRFNGTVDFGADFGTSDTRTSFGSGDIFVTMINASGAYAWTKQMGGSDSDSGYSVTTDASGNVYLTGYFYNTVDFGADFGASDTKTADGNGDVFVTKINASGAYAWTKQFGGSSYDYADSITADSSGNVYLTGAFYGTVDFGADFGTSETKTSAGNGDVFVTKINASGTYGWTKRMGGSDFDEGYSISTDTSGNVYVTGQFKGTADFGADFGKSVTKTSSGDYDIFVTKINASGTYGWTKRMGGSGYDNAYSIMADSSGNVFLTGEFAGTADFGADFGTSDTKTSSGGSDIFVTKILP